MKIDANDPRWTAYALGELEDDSERAEIESILKESEEMRALVEDIRRTAAWLNDGLKDESFAGLTPDQRGRIEVQAAKRRGWFRSRPMWTLAGVAAACVLIVFVWIYRSEREEGTVAHVAELRNETASVPEADKSAVDENEPDVNAPSQTEAAAGQPAEKPAEAEITPAVGVPKSAIAQAKKTVPVPATKKEKAGNGNAIPSSLAINAAKFVELKGTVQDTRKSFLPGATVTAVNENTKVEAVASTDGSGNYNFAGLLPGTYTISAALGGFQKHIAKDVKLGASAHGSIDFILAALKAGEAPEVVTTARDILWESAPAGGGVLAAGSAYIQGTIMDTSHGVLPGVTVTATNVDTNVETVVLSNSSGNYDFASLQPGDYTISAQLDGFQKFTAKGIKLRPYDKKGLDVTLPVASLTANVEVVTTAQDILTESSPTAGTVLTNEEVAQLPLIDNDVLDLVNVMGGVQSGVVEGRDLYRESQSFAGVDTRAINIQQDGLNINDVDYKTGINSKSRINPDLVAEYKLVLSPADAEYGRGTGQVQVLTRAPADAPAASGGGGRESSIAAASSAGPGQGTGMGNGKGVGSGRGGGMGAGTGGGIGSGVGRGMGPGAGDSAVTHGYSGGIPGGVAGGVVGGVPGGIPGGVLSSAAQPRYYPPPPPPPPRERPPYYPPDRRWVPPRYVPGPNGEGYDNIVDNPYMDVSQNPLSTFSIDVDKASYANVRRFIERNQLPPRNAVRIEELVNYFDYDYKGPGKEGPFAAHFEMTDAPWNGAHRLLKIGLKAKEVKRKERPASNLVFLLDVSGSMSDYNKLPLVQSAMRLLVDQLTESDHVSIVTYAGTTQVVLPSTRGDQKWMIYQAIDRLRASGSTNGAGGIQLAYDVARVNFIKGGVNRVILATDGDFNVGITSQPELTRLIEEKADSGVFLSALGFGMGNYKDNTLETLANKGRGNYAYIDTIEEARRVLVEEISGTLVGVAKDVKIQVEFNPGKVAAYRLIGYEDRVMAKEDFNNDAKKAGVIGAGHAVTALYEIVPAGTPIPSGGVDQLRYQKPLEKTEAAKSDEVGWVKIRYKNPDEEESNLMTFPVRDSKKDFGKASADFKFAASVAAFGMILRDSPYRGSATLQEAVRWAEEGKGEDPHGYRQEFIRLLYKVMSMKY